MDSGKKEVQPQQNAHGSPRRFFIVFTVGIPGIGKSFIINKLKDYIQQQKDYAMEISTSDEIRSSYLAEYYKLNNIDVEKLTQEELFKIEVDQGAPVRQGLYDDIRRKLKKLLEDNARESIFVLDKNHCNKQLIAYVESQVEEIFQEQQAKFFILVPDTLKEGEDRTFYPFHFETISVGLIRSLTRKEHLTMKYGAIHSLLSFTTCLTSQLKESFDEKFPPAKYTRIEVSYYLRQQVEDEKKKPTIVAALEKLKELILAVVQKKTEAAAACSEIEKQVAILVPINAFFPSKPETYKAMLEAFNKQF